MVGDIVLGPLKIRTMGLDYSSQYLRFYENYRLEVSFDTTIFQNKKKKYKRNFRVAIFIRNGMRKKQKISTKAPVLQDIISEIDRKNQLCIVFFQEVSQSHDTSNTT